VELTDDAGAVPVEILAGLSAATRVA